MLYETEPYESVTSSNEKHIVFPQICTDIDDANKLHKDLCEDLNNIYRKHSKKPVLLHMSNIDVCTTNFLNIVIGQLYGKYSEDYIKKNVAIDSINPDDMQLFKMVVNNAKKYYKAKEGLV